MLRKHHAKSEKIKGMVRVTGTTYRITRTGAGVYEVTRIRDDQFAGAFVLGSKMRLVPGALGTSELQAVARAAIQNAMCRSGVVSAGSCLEVPSASIVLYAP